MDFGWFSTCLTGPQDPFRQSSFSNSLQHVLVCGLFLCRCRNLLFCLLYLMRYLSAHFSAYWDPFEYQHHFVVYQLLLSVFLIMSKFAEHVFFLIIQLINKVLTLWVYYLYVLGCCCPPVLFLQEILGLFKFPMSITAWKSEIMWSFCLCFPDQVSCIRHTQFYQPLWCDL